METVIENRLADFPGDRAVPYLLNVLFKNVSDRSFQPRRAAQEEISSGMYLAPFERAGADQFLFW